jgi:hypothetical protein
VNKIPTDTGGKIDRVFGDFKELMEAMVGSLEEESSLLAEARLVFHSLDDLIHLRIPMVFLKEFRDVVDPTKACYQSLIETVSSATAFYTAKLYGSEFEITIGDCASAPIVADLGLSAGSPIKSLMSFYVNFDFQIGTGKEIWSA